MLVLVVWLLNVLLQDKVPVLGVVHVPVTGKTYYAVAGKGAFVRDAEGATRQIHCKEFAITDPGLVVVGSASHANPSDNGGGCAGGGGGGDAGADGMWQPPHDSCHTLCWRERTHTAHARMIDDDDPNNRCCESCCHVVCCSLFVCMCVTQ